MIVAGVVTNLVAANGSLLKLLASTTLGVVELATSTNNGNLKVEFISPDGSVSSAKEFITTEGDKNYTSDILNKYNYKYKIGRLYVNSLSKIKNFKGVPLYVGTVFLHKELCQRATKHRVRPNLF